MKRSLLIAGGTIGGLGAVMAITPPQLGGNSSLSISGDVSGSGTSTLASASSSSAATTAVATKAAKPVATKKSTAVASKATAAKATATKATASATPTATKTTAAATAAAAGGKTSINGSFTGPAVFVQYGNVQVKITVVNGRITDAVAVQNPGQGRNGRYTNMALPVLKAQTLAAQSANIQGASGASYTSYGWYKSLQGALADAGL